MGKWHMSGARGEQIVTDHDGNEWRLLFTNRAISEAEQTTGRSVIAVTRGFDDGSSGITELAQLIRAGLTAARRDGQGGRAASMTDAFNLLDALGFEKAAVAVMGGIAAVLTYTGPEDGAGEGEGDRP